MGAAAAAAAARKEGKAAAGDCLDSEEVGMGAAGKEAAGSSAAAAAAGDAAAGVLTLPPQHALSLALARQCATLRSEDPETRSWMAAAEVVSCRVVGTGIVEVVIHVGPGRCLYSPRHRDAYAAIRSRVAWQPPHMMWRALSARPYV